MKKFLRIHSLRCSQLPETNFIVRLCNFQPICYLCSIPNSFSKPASSKVPRSPQRSVWLLGAQRLGRSRRQVGRLSLEACEVSCLGEPLRGEDNRSQAVQESSDVPVSLNQQPAPRQTFSLELSSSSEVTPTSLLKSKDASFFSSYFPPPDCTLDPLRILFIPNSFTPFL